MLSPVKAVAAGAVAFAIGGVLLFAQPFGPSTTSVPGATTDGALVDPVEFSGAFVPGPTLVKGTIEAVRGHVEERGQAWQPTIVRMSDPRLDGTLTYSSNTDRYRAVYELGTATFRIENDAGAWEGSAPFFSAGDRVATIGGTLPVGTLILVGEGGYQGLYAALDGNWKDLKGVIFPAPPPEAPATP